MNKNLVIGLVIVAGIGLYLYNRNKQKSTTSDMNFANAVGSSGFRVIGQPQRSNVRCGGCPTGSECVEVRFPNGNYGYRCVDMNAGRITK